MAHKYYSIKSRAALYPLSPNVTFALAQSFVTSAFVHVHTHVLSTTFTKIYRPKLFGFFFFLSSGGLQVKGDSP